MVVPGFASEIHNVCVRIQKDNAKSEHTLTHPAKDSLRWKDHILPKHRILLHYSINPSNQATGCPPLVKHARAHKDRPNWGKLVKGLRVEKLSAGLVGELEEAARKIVSYGVAEDILTGFLGRDVPALARGNEDELALVLLMTGCIG